MGESKTSRRRSALAPWLRKRLPAGGAGREVSRLLEELHLSTVCTEAHCPNQAECHARGTATFLILGDRCTRRCRFCAIAHGDPLPPREDEPQAVAEACARMGLRYVVVTSVTRDDLPDGGTSHFARTIGAIRARLPQTKIEVLTPDFQGTHDALDVVLAARPDVFDHNVETVPRLYPSVRPPAAPRGVAPDYHRSLEVLSYAKEKLGTDPTFLDGRSTAHGSPLRKVGSVPSFSLVKSGLMLGVGETDDEVRAVLADLRGAGVDILTLGQYLAPSADHWPVARFVEPAEFTRWESEAKAMGFPVVVAGPFVRSSYHAETAYAEREDS
jgi:lipoic acid synthetase